MRYRVDQLHGVKTRPRISTLAWTARPELARRIAAAWGSAAVFLVVIDTWAPKQKPQRLRTGADYS